MSILWVELVDDDTAFCDYVGEWSHLLKSSKLYNNYIKNKQTKLISRRLEQGKDI